MSVRVRFAPSPTGDLHVGSARSALFNWLYARARGGTYILRIEDTDEERNKEAAIAGILDGFRWLDLQPDEGPFFQSERKALYAEYVDRLLASGGAYRCACSVELLDERRKVAQAEKRPYRYEGTCRGASVSADVPHVVRARIPSEGDLVFVDRALGEIRTPNDTLDDFIIARSNGVATYNFVVVVDDIDMRITHVIRGNDHVANTPKQIHLYRLLGVEPPEFTHLPMVHGEDGKKLSKRHGVVGVLAYRDLGYLPEAMLSHLSRLGWSHGEQEEFTREELIQYFDLDGLGRAAAVFDMKRLDRVNGLFLRKLTVDELVDRVRPFVVALGFDPGAPFLRRAVASLQERSVTLVDVAKGLAPFYAETLEFDPRARRKFLNADAAPRLTGLVDALEDVERWEAPTLEASTGRWLTREGVELKQVGQAVRVGLTGTTVSPPLFDVMEILGRTKTLDRLRAAAALAATPPVEEET